MNKIKAIYDVVKTMKEKTSKEGVLQVKVERDDQSVWQFKNEFQRSAEGSAKCKLQTEWNWDGNEGKHESTTEFTRKNQEGCPHSHLRMKHFGHHGHFGHMHHHRGFKSKADALLFFLKMLNELKVEEQGENLLFSLVLDDEAKKVKERIQEKCQQQPPFQGHPHHHPMHGKLMKEFWLVEQPHIQVNIIVNKDKEVEKATVTFQGSYEKDGNHEIKATAEVNFIK